MRWFNGGDEDLDLFAKALVPRELPDRGPASWLKDRARFLYTTFVTAWRRSRSGVASIERGIVLYDPAITWDPKILEYRRTFIEHHFGERAEALLGSKGVLGSGERTPSAAERKEASRWRRRSRLAALLALMDFSARRYYWWGGIFLDVQTFAQVAESVERAYVFRLYDRRSYCVGTYLQRFVADDVRFVYQGMPLWGNQRYLHVPVTAVVTTKVNVPEVEWFRRNGYFKAVEVVYRSQEFVLDRLENELGEVVYDLGFFASGDWARRGGGRYWSADIEAIRRGDYRGNPFEKEATEVLGALAAYARERGLTLRIYMHPYERMLLDEHGIEPPFRHLEDGSLVTIDDRPGTSRGSVHEPKVAVAVRSSTIWERIDLGLELSYIYAFGDQTLDVFDPESLGEYRANVFGTIPELVEKLDAALKPQNSDAQQEEI